jgi:hypothetical protein
VLGMVVHKRLRRAVRIVLKELLRRREGEARSARASAVEDGLVGWWERVGKIIPGVASSCGL